MSFAQGYRLCIEKTLHLNNPFLIIIIIIIIIIIMITIIIIIIIIIIDTNWQCRKDGRPIISHT